MGTIIAWSLNSPLVSQKYELGAPSFEQRLLAARKVQGAGYRVRIRLDPIVPIQGWKEEYAGTIRRIFDQVSPESITIGTLRFEEGFHKMRKTIFSKDCDLPQFLERMEPMFPPKSFPGYKGAKSGKYGFREEDRAEIFGFVIGEIRKYSDCPIALCKESANVWNKVSLPLSKCSCACQLAPVDMAARMGSPN
jgi:spore photoproduct lyase